jgi:hypothetical protein
LLELVAKIKRRFFFEAGSMPARAARFEPRALFF